MYNFYIKNTENGAFKRIMSVEIGCERKELNNKKTWLWNLDDVYYEVKLKDVDIEDNNKGYHYEVEDYTDMYKLVDCWRDDLIDSLWDERQMKILKQKNDEGVLYVEVNGERVFDLVRDVKNIKKKTDKELEAIVDYIPFKLLDDNTEYKLAV